MKPETQERPGSRQDEGRDFDDEFNRLASTPDMVAAGDQAEAAARDGLQSQEKNPVTNPGATPENVFGYTDNQEGEPKKGAGKKGLLSATRAKWAAAIAGAGITAFLGIGALAPISVVHFLEVLIPDLTTATPALKNAHTSILKVRTKLLGNTKAVSGCTVLSIKCKLKNTSMSSIQRYERAGFKIEYEKTKIPGRVQMKSIQFKDTVYTNPEEFMSAIAKNTNGIKTADLRATNMRYLSTTFGRFTQVVLDRWGISKSKPGLKGTARDRLNQLLTASGGADASDVRFSAEVDADGNPILDADGKPTFTLDGGDPGTTYSQDQVNEMQKNVAKVVKAESRPSTQKLNAVRTSTAFTNILKATLITGALDIACSLNKMVGATAIGAKTATVAAMIDTWQPMFAIAQSVKTGDPVPSEDIAAVQQIVTKVDTRTVIANPDGSGGTIPNPNLNTTAMNSPLPTLSATGELRNTTAETDQLTSGLSVEKLLGPVGGAYLAFNDMVTKNGCAFIQNWAVRGASLVVGVIAAIGTAGGELALQGAFAGAMAGAMYIAQVALSNIIHGPDMVDLFNSGSAEAIGSSAWLSYATMMGSHAASIGLAPGNKADIESYQRKMTQVNNEYIALEKEDAKNNPLDLLNQYSFVGSMGRSYASATNYNSSPVSVARGILALATGKITSSAQTAYADEDYTEKRFSLCTDSAQKQANYDGDVGCNIRFVEKPGDAALVEDSESTAQWMEDNGYVEPETLTGLPAGYTLPDTGAEQKTLIGAITGTVAGGINSFANQFVNTRALSYNNNNYAIYLDYCAYRTLPYGEQYGENSAINAVAEGWITGAKCSENTTEMSHFRAYTTILSAQQAEDEESFEGSSSTVGESGAGSSTGVAPGAGSIPVIGTTVWPISTADWPGNVFDCDFRYQSEGGTVHTGIDISVSYKPVYAAIDGIIRLPGSGMVNIEFKDKSGKTMYFNYQHLSQRVDKSGDALIAGKEIKAGDKIGVSGKTNTVSPHLHLSLWDVPIVSGHSLPSSIKGSAALSHMWHPLSVLPVGGRPATACGSAPYHVPGGH